jgi:CheY-like chemotaxis protein
VTERKILIVDDDPIARRVLYQALASKGYQPLMAGDAMAALTEAQKHRPDLILLDLGLPAGGGFTFLKRLHTFPHLALIPVVVISGQEKATAEPAALEAGAREFIQKPARPEDVLAVLERNLSQL